VTSEIQWSDEVYKIFEVDSQTFKLTRDNIESHFHPSDQLNLEPGFYANLEENEIIESEQRIVTGLGNQKWILERLNLIKDKDGKPIRIDGITVDITKRKLHEQEIVESNERFKILAKATVEVIIDWDIKNKTVMWGEGFKTILGYDLNCMNKHSWSQNIHPDDRKLILSELNKTLLDPTKHHFNAEFRFMKANGEVSYMQHRGIFVRDEKGKATRAIGAMIDLTETLEKMKKIEYQNRMLKEIAWTQSHVVRAPLANLMGLIGLMKNNIKTGVSDKVLVGYISNSADQLDSIIHDIVSKTSRSEGE
jgi:PAS domain S-box-containing protein